MLLYFKKIQFLLYLISFPECSVRELFWYLILYTKRKKVGTSIFHQKVPHVLLTMDAVDVIPDSFQQKQLPS